MSELGGGRDVVGPESEQFTGAVANGAAHLADSFGMNNFAKQCIFGQCTCYSGHRSER